MKIDILRDCDSEALKKESTKCERLIPATEVLSEEFLRDDKILTMLERITPDERWKWFNHEIIKTESEAQVDENGWVWVRVHVHVREWIGDKKLACVTKYGFGMTIHLTDFWAMAEGNETPFKHGCKGKLCEHRHQVGTMNG